MHVSLPKAVRNNAQNSNRDLNVIHFILGVFWSQRVAIYVEPLRVRAYEYEPQMGGYEPRQGELIIGHKSRRSK